jgi:hypothetical protein
MIDVLHVPSPFVEKVFPFFMSHSLLNPLCLLPPPPPSSYYCISSFTNDFTVSLDFWNILAFEVKLEIPVRHY